MSGANIREPAYAFVHAEVFRPVGGFVEIFVVLRRLGYFNFNPVRGEAGHAVAVWFLDEFERAAII